MKTPREALLARHRAADAKLDQIRLEAVRAAADMNRRSPPVREFTFAATFIRSFALLYRELILPCRRTWAALAAIWLVILGFHIGNADTTGAGPSNQIVSMQDLRFMLTQRRVLLAELIQLPPTEPPEQVKPSNQPRSERHRTSACA